MARRESASWQAATAARGSLQPMAGSATDVNGSTGTATRMRTRPGGRSAGIVSIASGMARRATGHGWQLAGRRQPQRAPGGIRPAPALWFRTFRRWSPGVMPPLMGTVLLLVAGALATRGIGRSTPLVDAHTLLTLFLIYLIGGTAFGLLLYLSTNTTAWWIVLTGGVVAYLLVTVVVIGGPLTGAFAAVLLAAAVGRYGHRHAQPVADGTVAVTALAGGYHRTLRPGMSVLVPGERVLATFDTTERRFTCPTQRIRLRIEEGTRYLSRAAATVAYNLVPAEAHRAAMLGEQWERELQDIVCMALQRALTEWSEAVLAAEDEVPDRLLARQTLHHLRAEARARGVHIVWVSVRDIWLAPEGETLPVDEWDDEESDGADGEEEPALDASASVSVPHVPQRALLEAPALPPAHLEEDHEDESAMEPARAATAASSPVAMSPDVLSAAYEAVREGRIHDPDTIRGIAQAFLEVATDPELNAEFPFDAVSAAKILRERAKRLDRELQAAQKPFDGN